MCVFYSQTLLNALVFYQMSVLFLNSFRTSYFKMNEKKMITIFLT